VIVMMAALIPLMAAGAQGAVPTLSLSQAIDAALANGDDNKVLQDNLDVARAQHALNVSKDSLTLAGSAGYTYATPFGTTSLLGLGLPIASAASPSPQGGTAGLALSGPLTTVAVSAYPWIPPSAGADNTSSLGITASQTLWNGYPGGPTQATVDKSLLTLSGKEIATDASRLTLIYSIKQAYYTMLSAQRTLDLNKQILDKQNAVLKQLQQIYALKLASLVDLKSAELNAQVAQVGVDSAQHDLRFARIALATYMGVSADQIFAVADAEDPSIPVSTVEEAVAQGLSRRADLKQFALSVRSSAIDLALAKGQGTPTISLNGGVNFLLDWDGVAAGTANAGVKVSLPILDAGGVQSQVTAAQKQIDASTVQETQLRKGIITTIQNDWDNVQLAKERLTLAQLTADTNELQLKIVTAQRDNGTASNQDMLTAAVNAANAEDGLATARSAVQLATLLLLNAMGY